MGIIFIMRAQYFTENAVVIFRPQGAAVFFHAA
jgi:hypothetical protein